MTRPTPGGGSADGEQNGTNRPENKRDAVIEQLNSGHIARVQHFLFLYSTAKLAFAHS